MPLYHVPRTIVLGEKSVKFTYFSRKYLVSLNSLKLISSVSLLSWTVAKYPPIPFLKSISDQYPATKSCATSRLGTKEEYDVLKLKYPFEDA